MLTSIRARLAFLPLVVILAAQCVGDPTSPSAHTVDGLTPSLATAALEPVRALEGTPRSFFCGTSSDAEGDPLVCEWDFENDGLLDAVCTTHDSICRWDLDHDGLFEGSRSGSFDMIWPDNRVFDVRLRVSDATSSSELVQRVTVADVAPTITGREPLIFDVGVVQRAQTRITDPGADAPWTFVFDWGDGTVIGPRNVPGPNIGFGQFHAYADTGTYALTVTITDKDGVQSSWVRMVSVVHNQHPVADAGGPYIAQEGTPFTLSTAATVDDQQELLTYLWDFGDGTRSVLANPSKRYTDDGSWPIRLIVTDPTGAVDTAYTSVVVENVAPGGTPSVPNTQEGTPFLVTLNGYDVGNVDRYSLEYSFDCGVGAGATPWSASRSTTCPGYPDQGVGTVTLSVRDKDGAVTTYVRNPSIRNLPPVASLTALSATTIPVGGTVQFEGSISDPGAAEGPFTYSYRWNDGGMAAGTVATEDTPVPGSHTFTRAGTFTVVFIAIDKDGSSNRAYSTVTVTE